MLLPTLSSQLLAMPLSTNLTVSRISEYDEPVADHGGWGARNGPWRGAANGDVQA